MKNYLEHETEVKFVDGILAKNQEWQWFIDCIEENFELDDINTYTEFQNRNNPLRRVLGNFLKVIEASDKKLDFKQDVLRDLFEIAQFSIGVVSIGECKEIVTTNMGKIFLAIVWLSKIENVDNETDYVVDMRFLSQNNFHQAINMQSFATEEDEIISFLESIVIEGFAAPRKCIIDNLNQISYGVTEGFIEKYSDNLLSANAFNFQTIQKYQYLTWQENTLLDMLSVSINKRTITPTFMSGNTIVPDYRTWTSDVINQIKGFFKDSAANFVAESIDYIKNGIAPDRAVVDTHCRMLKKLIEEGDEFNVYSSSTYTVIAAMFSDGTLKNVERNGDLLDLIKCIQKIDSMALLLRLREDKFPLSKDQSIIIKKYITEKYKSIEEFEDIYYLKDYLGNKDIAKNVTQPYYDMIMPKFLNMINEPRKQLIPTLFYQAMLFLIELNQTNQQVDKRKVKEDMIGLQEYWQNSIYEEQCKTLHEFEYSTSVVTEDIDKFSNAILANPIFLAKKCLISSTDNMIETMNSMSEHAIIYMVNKMVLSPIYPLKSGKVEFDNHDIDKLLRTQVEEVKEKYGYKFRNVLETDTYVSGIHEKYREFAFYIIPMFNGVGKLYHLIEDILSIKFIPYDDEIQLGHLTQLFPILEIQIRKLGKMVGIVPFKERASEFMKFKNPSSVLRELLEDIFQELGSFENVPDLLFVYHFMYNGNSLNVRNECIHGRDYLSGSQLKFAFKVTLLALYMIIYRIEVIEKNMESEK